MSNISVHGSSTRIPKQCQSATKLVMIVRKLWWDMVKVVTNTCMYMIVRDTKCFKGEGAQVKSTCILSGQLKLDQLQMQRDLDSYKGSSILVCLHTLGHTYIDATKLRMKKHIFAPRALKPSSQYGCKRLYCHVSMRFV